VPENTVVFTKIDHIAYITLKGNANRPETARALEEACGRIKDDESVYVIILTDSGKNDVEFHDGERGEIPSDGSAAIVAAIDRPVIAVIHGEALGPWLEIALSADIRIASDKARFGLPQVAGGRIPADGGTQRLPRIIGRGKALEMLLTAEPISVKEALEIGLVSKVVPSGELDGEAQKLAETIAAKGPLALRYLKEAIIKGMDMTLEQGLRLEADLYFLLHTTADRTEGIKSYLEKRKPEYKGK
jgi:enoyl-CoA hydratase/carnithine racemase